MCQNCKKPYYITTAIAYTSGKPHIGNTYEIVLADSIARYKRAQGYDVRFQTGTDEHGQKIELKAEEAGVTPKEFVDNVSGEIKKIWDLMDTSYDKFIRTTDEDHEKQVQKIFKKLYDQGDIYKGHYEGMYCTPCESFFTESQLVDGKCPDCGREVQPAKEEAYFFKMSKYADRLIEHINTHPEFIQPVSRKNEMMNNFLLPGLQDLCVSRTSFKWGIPVDFDPNESKSSYGVLRGLRSETCNLRMAGCAYKLYHRNRIRLRWKQHGAVSQIMAGRSASDRKRYHSLPYNLLANLFDGTGSSASKTGIRTSMAASGRRKNE